MIVLGDLGEDVVAELDETGKVGQGKRDGMEGLGELADFSGIDAGDGATCDVGLSDGQGLVVAAGFA